MFANYRYHSQVFDSKLVSSESQYTPSFACPLPLRFLVQLLRLVETFFLQDD